MEYFVAKTGNDSALGTKEQPFLTISRAAQVAAAGDTVTCMRVYTENGYARKTAEPRRQELCTGLRETVKL